LIIATIMDSAVLNLPAAVSRSQAQSARADSAHPAILISPEAARRTDQI
jgi:hypothetical protein